MPQISLTASMRSNLLSLQNISGQVSLTQNRLATGKKVNSAIDNPSSFYTASSLNNRAKDLDNLLDAMSQATSTIKAATTTLETATNFLEQASAVATQALETAIPAKEYFENLVGENGAVVTTAQELKDAVTSGKETICVYGKIDYFENETLTLKDGQNLVGTEYFTGYTGKEKFSQINFNGNQENTIYCHDTTNIVSDLKLFFENKRSDFGHLIYTIESNIKLNNLDVELYAPQTSQGWAQAAICINDDSNAIFSGIINVKGKSALGGGIWITKNSKGTIDKETTVNLDTSGSEAYKDNWGFVIYNNSTVDLYGNLNIKSTKCGFFMGGASSNNNLNIYSSAQINMHVKSSSFALGKAIDNISNKVNIEKNANLNICDNYEKKSLQSNGTTFDNNTSSYKYINNDTIMFHGDFIQTESTIDWDNWQAVKEREKDTSTEDADKQYSEILSQYDGLINDASYKGINLLKQDDLKVNFNENNSSSLEIKGKDMSTSSLGFVTKDWSNQGDIAQTLKEISSALNSIRNYNAELGNNYSIISSRQDFTENLINILTEGADKLTLADMNEESANMLALQTRQQLAINSLSLASQASQSILKLF